jgi:hypothetical protein
MFRAFVCPSSGVLLSTPEDGHINARNGSTHEDGHINARNGSTPEDGHINARNMYG